MMAAHVPTTRTNWDRFYKCDRKVFHATREQADFAADRMTREFYGESFEAYKCKHCHGWHVGHAR